MRRQGNSRPQSGYGTYGEQVDGAGSDGSTHSSNSSGSSNIECSVIRPSLKPVSRTKTPEQHSASPTQANSPVSPKTPTSKQSSFSLNGHRINETYKPRSRTTPSPGKPSTPVSPAFRTSSPRQGVITQNTSTRHLTRLTRGHWALRQEQKVKVLGIPKHYWTKDVYFAMCDYGSVIKIDMEPGSRDNNAWVIFQPPPPTSLPAKFRISRSYEIRQPTINTVFSPVNPAIQYQELNIIQADCLEFGVQTGEKSLVSMHQVHAVRRIRLKLDLQRKELDIQFPQIIDGQNHIFSFRLPISQLSFMYKGQEGDTTSSLTIPFDRPPQFFAQKKPHQNDMSLFSPKDRIWTIWKTMFRETDVVDGRTRRDMQELPLLDRRASAVIDIGRWTIYRLSFPDDALSGPQYEDFRDALRDFGVTFQESERFTISSEPPFPLTNILEDEFTGTHSHLQTSQTTSSIFDDLAFEHIHLSFHVRYQLEACLSNGFIKESNVTREFLGKLVSTEPQYAVRILENVVDRQRVYYNPMDIFKLHTKLTPRRSIPRYCVMQRSVNITPTMMHVASPVMEISNRITRQYLADADRFIRVKFTDEKSEGALRSSPDGKAEALFDRVYRAMRRGIVVAGRYYEFLAFGNSQFREAGAYFYAPTSTKSAHDIRATLGRFDHIKTVAKYGARLGQCFSTTRAMQNSVTLRTIPDIERNGFTFTDGVGKLSLFLAQLAAQDLGLQNAFDDPPTLFQFRLGGCKGVLALEPAIKKTEVHIRPSQSKFVAPYNGLEIIRCSSLATPFFNRQIITLLSDLGVSQQVFMQKQHQMVNAYELAMTDKSKALECLRKHIDMNQTTLVMASMVLDGFLDTREPFMMSLLHLWRASTIKELKKKARIAVDDGAFVLGCIDESGLLRGHRNEPQSSLDATREEKIATLPEIFIQVDDTDRKGHYKVVEGICILARNPSLHPGDIRVVRAVNTPALHHHKNVVVLPQTGDRDLANMCSGGDLDGDDYMVLWDQDLQPTLINVPPMDFTSEKPIEQTDPIDISHVVDFFVTYMKNDSLGPIAHAHLAQADLQPGGVNSDVCIELARLHSRAVDYSKSGLPAIMDPSLRPKKWPHFMEKRHLRPNQEYRSKNILGLLYDQVQLVDFLPVWQDNFDQRILDAFDRDETLLERAAEIKTGYDGDLKRLMAKHGVQTEFEAFSVFVLEHNEETRDYKFAEEFGRIIGVIKAQYRAACITASGATSIVDWDHIGPFVAAMYTVSAEQMRDALKECKSTRTVGGQQVPVRKMEAEHMPLMSFPWIFHSEMGKLATGSTSKPKLDPFRVQRPQRHRTNVWETEERGLVETEGGVTLYGEVLNLDFGSAQAVGGLEQMHEETGDSEEEREAGWRNLHTGSPSVSSPSVPGLQAFRKQDRDA